MPQRERGDWKALGTRLSFYIYRDEIGITFLANKLKYNRRAVYRWINGESKIRPETLGIICNILNLTNEERNELHNLAEYPAVINNKNPESGRQKNINADADYKYESILSENIQLLAYSLGEWKIVYTLAQKILVLAHRFKPTVDNIDTCDEYYSRIIEQKWNTDCQSYINDVQRIFKELQHIGKNRNIIEFHEWLKSDEYVHQYIWELTSDPRKAIRGIRTSLSVLISKAHNITVVADHYILEITYGIENSD